METNFFKQFEGLNLSGDVQLTIGKTEAGYVVLVTLVNTGCGDKAAKLLQPLTLRGSASELDNEFFSGITTPLQAASGLLVDMDNYMKQLDTVRKQSAMEKEKGDKEKKETDARDKKYTDAIKKSKELETEGKFREAYSKVPNASDYPEHAQEIKERRAALSTRFDEGSLFGQRTTENVEP